MKILKPLILVATIAASSTIFPMKAQAQRVLGGVNIDVYCRNRFGNAARAVLVENTAYGWRCRVGKDLVTLSIDNACRFQYNNQRAYSRTTNSREPYSWQCVIN
jgi:hypothetical protein